MNEDPMWLRWQAEAPRIYEEVYYSTNLVVTHINEIGHTIAEKPFGADTYFPQVLEVGAGTGKHLEAVRHRFDAYYVTDISKGHLEKAKTRWASKPGLVFQEEDATKLSFKDGTFDRLISIYNLEHLPRPDLVVQEWRRVVKPGGTLTIGIPAEGGVAWRLGRFLTTRPAFAKHGLDLDYIIAREHVNTCVSLACFLRHYLRVEKETWYPLRIPLVDVNLLYICQATNPGGAA